MLKIYIENTSSMIQGGGFSFLKNFSKTLKDKVDFVDNWQDCDIIFVFGITAIDKTRVHEAVNAGKHLVLRADNVPKASRNRRQSPAERLKEFGQKASLVIYQSEWAKEFAGYFAGDGIVINNGVDPDIFNTKDRKSDGKTYLYCNYNDNPNKHFEEALYWFELEWRKDNEAHLIIAGNAPSLYTRNPEYNWDLNVPAKVEYVGVKETPEQVAEVMKQSDFLIYPAFADCYPNTILESMACGVRPLYLREEGGNKEAYNNSLDLDRTRAVLFNKEFRNFDFKNKDLKFKVKTIEEMGSEYLSAFEELI